jgi:malate dehydrogenase (oxaloacetate-decarboxylating)(NADP+)
VRAALLLEAGMADACLCGGTGDWFRHWHHAFDVIGKREEVGRVYALSALIVPNGHLFFVDTHLTVDPTAEQVADMTLLAAEQIRAFGITPKAALLSHSSFGASGAPSAKKMRAALQAAARPRAGFRGGWRDARRRRAGARRSAPGRWPTAR